MGTPGLEICVRPEVGQGVGGPVRTPVRPVLVELPQ